MTGCTSGMGLDTAQLLLDCGAQVVVTGRTLRTLDEAVEQLTQGAPSRAQRLLGINSDAAKLDDVDRLLEQTVERFGEVHGLFANAGIGIFKPTAELTEADFDQLVNINFRGLFFVVQKTLPHLADGGSIVLNASWTAHRGLLGAHLYSATKAAVLSLARTLSHELAERRIRVNSVSRGYIRTPIVEKIDMDDTDVQRMAKEVSLGRWGTGKEIANPVAFLRSDEASYNSGEDLLIDGGMVGGHRPVHA